MEKNQNDNRNQSSDSKSKQSSTIGDKNTEINPNNPTANKNQPQGNDQHRSSTISQIRSVTGPLDSDDNNEAVTNSKIGAAKEKKYTSKK